MSEPKVGQRVRVVLEGVVTVVEHDNFQIGPRGADNVIFPDAEHVVSVEILRPPVKVGDVIETAEELDALPHRAAVREQASPWRIWERSAVDRCWRTPGNRVEVVSVAVLLPAKVLDLPDGAA
jgi:hypothetical protein